MRYCRRAGVILTELEYAHADGTFNRRTGAVKRSSPEVCIAYQAVGSGPALGALRAHPAVARWEPALGVRPPAAFAGPRLDRYGVPLPAKPAPTPRDVSATVRRELLLRRLSRDDRRAAEEMDRRRTLTADERDAVALAEAAELPH